MVGRRQGKTLDLFDWSVGVVKGAGLKLVCWLVGRCWGGLSEFLWDGWSLTGGDVGLVGGCDGGVYCRGVAWLLYGRQWVAWSLR